MSPFIQIRQLHKSFGSNHVLRGVDLEVEKGESLVILGGSGAGKSVFLRHLAGLAVADTGRVLVDGQDLGQLSRAEMYRYRRRLGMSFQEGALFDSMSVFENIAFPMRRMRRNMSRDEVRRGVAACLEIVGMPTVGDLMPSQLSGGMRRRVGFARAIALEPEILLFDEPTTGLDPIMTTIVSDVISGMREKLKATTITITHDISSARKIATRVAMLFKGRVIHHDAREAFFNSDQPIVRQFIQGEADGPATDALLK